jgi:hypothetical protein
MMADKEVKVEDPTVKLQAAIDTLNVRISILVDQRNEALDKVVVLQAEVAMAAQRAVK